MAIDVRLLSPNDDAVLRRVAEGVFDHAVNPAWAGEFLRDPRHHIVVALDGPVLVGFASGVHYLHPDKPPELWMNEVGVAPSHRHQGIGKRVLQALLQVGVDLGCQAAWVLTDRSNPAALQLYGSLGGVVDPGGTVMLTFPLSPDQHMEKTGEPPSVW